MVEQAVVVESPFFQRCNKRARTSPSAFILATDHRLSESTYFYQSPATAWGSAQSLGSLLHCLSYTSDCVSRKDISTGNPVPCLTCLSCTQSVIRHFEPCPEFQREWRRLSLENDIPGTGGLLLHHVSCYARLVEQNVSFAVRHLCSHRCYMRAFAPYRAWYALRKRVVGLSTSDSVETALSGWRCVLEWPVVKVDSEDTNTSGTTPRTRFVSNSEEITFSNVPSLLKYIEHEACNKKEASLVTPVKEKQGSKPESNPISTKESDTVFVFRNFLEDRMHSPYGLLEELFTDDPWKLLLSTIFLNRTSRVQVDAVLFQFLNIWPTASDVASETNIDRMSSLLQPMGMRHRRALGIIRFSNEYLQLLARTKRHHTVVRTTGDTVPVLPHDTDGWSTIGRGWSKEDIMNLYYCGEYAYSAYQLFIQRNWDIDPHDHALKTYAEYQRAKSNLGGQEQHQKPRR
jgi:hypothetical protein